jgi:GrpB-like predicted nucleotidyltransferase (UPF0157 family)
VQTALGDTVIHIEHVGSTSAPGLAAKPIIDMMPLVRDVREVSKRITAMAAIGYIPRGEFGLPGRRYFVKGSAHARLVHCHIYAAGHPEVTRHLAFRDYLRTHPVARRLRRAQDRAGTEAPDRHRGVYGRQGWAD